MISVLFLWAGLTEAGLLERFGHFAQESRLLEADQAFHLTVSAPDPTTLRARWVIAPGYYLYRDKFRFTVLDAPEVTLTDIQIPAGESKEDPYFGPQQVFHNEVVITARLKRAADGLGSIEVKADYQGCAELGVCYPPLSQTVAVALPAPAAPVPPVPQGGGHVGARVESEGAGWTVRTLSVPPLAEKGTKIQADFTATAPFVEGEEVETKRETEQDRLARLLYQYRFFVIPLCLGLGLLLAFTPCVLPMVPILFSLIVGQGSTLSRRRAVALTLTYILAMSTAYTLVGVLAAFLGQNLQAIWQHPWVIGAFSGLFVLLALSLFGFYEVSLPTGMQQRLTAWSNRQQSGHYVGVAIMGVLSALIVSPCVAPPLIGILTFITMSGDEVLGAAALLSLGLGMGIPLLVLGVSMGHWLPRAGHWMERIKATFGVLLLAVALWLLERILPAPWIMVLWAILLIVTATYMGALQPVAHGAPGWRVLVKGLGVVLLIYGMLLLVGVAAGGRNPWQPLRGIYAVENRSQEPTALFRRVRTVSEVEQVIQAPRDRWVMVEIYADWCVTCKELERFTFSDPAVRTLLAQMTVLKADVTAYDETDRRLLQHFGLVGPPALLFFGLEGKERREGRIVGFVDAATFQAHLQALRDPMRK